jgi:hypothetical protein
MVSGWRAGDGLRWAGQQSPGMEGSDLLGAGRLLGAMEQQETPQPVAPN